MSFTLCTYTHTHTYPSLKQKTRERPEKNHKKTLNETLITIMSDLPLHLALDTKSCKYTYKILMTEGKMQAFNLNHASRLYKLD